MLGRSSPSDSPDGTPSPAAGDDAAPIDEAGVNGQTAVPAPPAFRSGINHFALAHAFSAAADALVTMSLADSLFFSVSADASRNQVLLYLSVTMVPFTLLAPLVGPMIDRFSTGHRLLAMLSYVLRSGAVIGLAVFHDDVAFYFFALLMLVLARAASVVKQALVPSLVESPDRLVAANSRLSLVGTVFGGVGGAVGGALLAVGDATLLLSIAATMFVGAAIVTTRIPIAERRIGPVLEQVEYQELHLPAVVAASNAYVAVRLVVGFFVFGLAFALRRDSEPAWMYVTAVGAYGVGVFVANVVAPTVSRYLRHERMMAAALAVLGVFSVLGAVGPSRTLIIAMSGVLGLSVGIGRQAFDAMLQHRAPLAMRGRAFARFETRFQLGWVAGGALATGLAVSMQINMVVVAIVLIPVTGLYLRAVFDEERYGEPAVPDARVAARHHLASAAEWLAHGAPAHAAVELAAGIDVLRLSAVSVPADVTARAASLRSHALDGDGTIVDADEVAACIDELDDLVSELSEP